MTAKQINRKQCVRATVDGEENVIFLFETEYDRQTTICEKNICYDEHVRQPSNGTKFSSTANDGLSKLLGSKNLRVLSLDT